MVGGADKPRGLHLRVSVTNNKFILDVKRVLKLFQVVET
jgi:hypothetical protein